MITLENNKLEKLVNTSKTIDMFLKKSIKLLVGLAVLTFVLYMFFTTENIIKYLLPLYSESTLWFVGGVIGIIALMKSMWLLELFLKTFKSVFFIMLTGVIFPFTYGLFLWASDVLTVGSKGIMYHFMYIINKYENILTSENSNFVVIGILIFAILYNIIDIKDDYYSSNRSEIDEDDYVANDTFYNYVESNSLYGDKYCN